MSDGTEFKPPYMAFQTFWNFITGWDRNLPLPPAIDRSLLSSKSGTDQANLLAALAAFKLVDDGNRVQLLFEALIMADDDGRTERLAALIERHYPEAMAVSRSNGTSADLTKVFTDTYPSLGPDTRRKAITFFLHAARTAGLPLSPHFPQTRSGSGAPGSPRARKRAAPKRIAAGGAPDRTAPPTTGGDTQQIELSSGGVVTLTVSVNLFSLSRDDREFVLDLVDRLKGYPAGGSAEVQHELGDHD